MERDRERERENWKFPLFGGPMDVSWKSEREREREGELHENKTAELRPLLQNKLRFDSLVIPLELIGACFKLGYRKIRPVSFLFVFLKYF